VATWHYIIGDIHGCLAELRALEAKVNRHAARHGVDPFIVSVGDLVDRGPDSAGVVRHFRAGWDAGTHGALLGNHEHEMLRVLAEFAPANFDVVGGFPTSLGPSMAERHRRGGRMAHWLTLRDYRDYVRLNWVGQGGATALASFGCDPERPATWHIPPDDMAFLATLPLVWEGPTALATHALASARDIATVLAAEGHPELLATLAWDEALHGILWNRQPPTAPIDPLRTHVSGHTPQHHVKRLPHINALMIDTGCVYGRRLTAWCAEADALLAVPSRQGAAT
jgi:hypothetical protein